MSKDEKLLAIKNVKSPPKNLDDFTQRSRQTVTDKIGQFKIFCKFENDQILPS